MTGNWDIKWINANLALSGRIPPDRLPALASQLGIDRVVDVRAERCDDAAVLRRFGIELLRLPTPDRQAVSPEMLRRGTAWVRAALSRRHKVLIHCEHGVGRSVLLAACVLVSLGMGCREALRILAERHGRVSLSPEQLEGLLEFAEEFRRAWADATAPVREDRVRTARG
jgi:protein-tyrosine phosphatase